MTRPKGTRARSPIGRREQSRGVTSGPGPRDRRQRWRPGPFRCRTSASLCAAAAARDRGGIPGRRRSGHGHCGLSPRRRRGVSELAPVANVSRRARRSATCVRYPGSLLLPRFFELPENHLVAMWARRTPSACRDHGTGVLRCEISQASLSSRAVRAASRGGGPCPRRDSRAARKSHARQAKTTATANGRACASGIP